MISIDTLRADFLPMYGHPTTQAPHLERLASQGTVYEHHISAAPTTLASHTALFTGTWPHSHGVPRNGFLVNPDNVMLAEVLSEAGYATAGFVSAQPLAAKFNFHQGFAHYSVPDGKQRSADATVDEALAWLGSADPERPLFLFAHFFDTHFPLDPPAAAMEPYDNPDQQGRKLRHALRGLDAEAAAGSQARAMNAQLKALYQGAITFVDSEIGRLFAAIDQHGVLEDAIVVVTADHGEEMLGHPDEEIWGHGKTVYDGNVHTPLIIRTPEHASGGTRSDRLVSNIDVMPTLLGLLSIGVPERSQGVSFLADLRGEEMAPRGAVFSEATKPHAAPEGIAWTNLDNDRAVRTASHTLVRHAGDGPVELFERKRATRLASGLPEPARKLRAALEAWDSAVDPLPSSQDLSKKTIEDLKALGYVE